MDDLIIQGIRAIKAGYKDEKEGMSGKNIEVYGLDKEDGLRLIEPETVQTYIDQCSENEIREETPTV